MTNWKTLFTVTFSLCSFRTTSIKKSDPVLYPRVKTCEKVCRQPVTTALRPSFSLRSITHDWEPCQANRCAKFQPPALWASFHFTALPPPCFVFYWFPSYLDTSACIFLLLFLLVFVYGRTLSSYGLCLRSAATSAWDLCVWDRERRYKNPELITELRQSEDKQPSSLRLHIQTQSIWVLQGT